MRGYASVVENRNPTAFFIGGFSPQKSLEAEKQGIIF